MRYKGSHGPGANEHWGHAFKAARFMVVPQKWGANSAAKESKALCRPYTPPGFLRQFPAVFFKQRRLFYLVNKA